MNRTRLVLLILTLFSAECAAQSDRPARAVVTALPFKLAARRSFAAGDSAKGREHLKALLAAYREHRGDDVVGSAQLAEVAHEYLRAGLMTDAIVLLGEAVDLNVPSDESQHNGLASVAAGWCRRLAMLDAEKRFELLYQWSMPNDSRRNIRVLTTITPTLAPPEVFARALGERPRRDSFSVPGIGGLRGLFSSAWELVTAADKCGRLRRLTAELEQLDDVANARTVLLLARIAAADGPDQRLMDEALAVSTDDFQSGLAIMGACLTVEWLQPIGLEITKVMLEQTYGRQSPLRPFLRIAHATAVQLVQGDSGPEVLHRNRLKYWFPVTGKTASQHAAGAVNAIWLVHDDHILHLGGGHNDVLFCRFPLTGDFDFTCETQAGGDLGNAGGLVFGGLQFEAIGGIDQLFVGDADLCHPVQKPCPFVRQGERPTFNRVSIRSANDVAVFAANLHPIWFDDANWRASPWLGLRSFGGQRPMFRNVRVVGDPVIPREVRLSVGNDLRGWQTQFFGETQPPFDTNSDRPDVSKPDERYDADWRIAEGVIHAAKRETAGSNPQSRLYYQRPLLDGEAVAYEFFHEPGPFGVHPALGRLVFLIEPDGVRIHWITDGEGEWTGLPEDNAVVEPFNRRGPRRLPLREKDWNGMKMSRASGKVKLSLNGTVVYQRDVDFGGDHTFGFYRQRTTTAAKIRNVVLTGDWPETLPADFVANPAVLAEEDLDQNSLARNELFGDQFMADNVAAVRRRAQQLDPLARYQFLADWVLPSDSHATIRLNGRFSPTGLDCPAVELVELAQQLGSLSQLRERVMQLSESGVEEQRRAKAAMLLLADLSSGNESGATKAVMQLSTLVRTSSEFASNRQWPEMVAAWFGLRHPQGRRLIADLVSEMYTQLLEDKESGSAAWSEQVASLHGLLQHLAGGGRVEDFARSPGLKNWIAASVGTARSEAEGFPTDHWRWDGSQLQTLSSHQQGLLFYRIPLRGDFEISGELPADALPEIQLMYAGEYIVPQEDFLGCGVGNVRQETAVPMEPPLTPPVGPPWFRIQVRDNVSTTWFNGRLVRRRVLAEDHDPWLAIRATSSRRHAAIRDLRIDGTPSVPGEVNLCTDEALNGWWPYYDERIGPGLDWQYIDDETGKGLRAERQADYARTHQESLLRYYRPLAEDDSLEYDFFYEPGRAHVHPALDGVAFLLQPDGVRMHSLTEGKYGQHEVDPSATVIEADCRRGPAELPLREGAWNRCRITARTNLIEVSLNDQLIYSRPLEVDSRRLFGLFRYAGESEVQVRNVFWRRQPAGTFDSIEQQLVTRGPSPLDGRRDARKAFAHDFVTSGLPTELFDVPSGGDVQIGVTRNGVFHSQRSGGKWADSSIASVLRMRGDFDLTARFAELHVTEPGYGGSAVVIRDEDGRVIQLSRRLQDNLHRVYLTWRDPVGDGEFRFVKDVLITEALAGKFRVARRGDTYYFLFAEYDSPVFRLVGSQTIEGAAQQATQLQLRAIASIGASASMLWKDVHITAEELTRLSFRASGRDVTNEHWAMIANARNLRELILDATNVSDDDLARLKNHPELRLLYLKDTRITSRGSQHFANLKKLEKLHLTSSDVDDDAAATIGDLTELRTLGLSNTGVGDAAIVELSRLAKLEVLGINRTVVTDDSAAQFAKMTSLKTLDLRNTQVSEAGVERIRKALPKCTVKH